MSAPPPPLPPSMPVIAAPPSPAPQDFDAIIRQRQVKKLLAKNDDTVCIRIYVRSSTQCCVLIGGEQYFFAGNKRGPTNYSNCNVPIVFHRDMSYLLINHVSNLISPFSFL